MPLPTPVISSTEATDSLGQISQPFTVYIVERQNVLRSFLLQLCRSICGCEVVGSSPCAIDSIDELRTSRPTIVVANARLPRASPLAFAKQLSQSCPGTRILFLVGGCDPLTISQIRKLEHSSIDHYNSGHSELVDAICGVAKRRFQREPIRERNALTSRYLFHLEHTLTPTETKVIGFLGAGASNNEIGELLGISAATAQVHRKRILRKMCFNRSADLFLFSLMSGLTQVEHLVIIGKLRLLRDHQPEHYHNRNTVYSFLSKSLQQVESNGHA